jgi:hypothetical protein
MIPRSCTAYLIYTTFCDIPVDNKKGARQEIEQSVTIMESKMKVPESQYRER